MDNERKRKIDFIAEQTDWSDALQVRQSTMQMMEVDMQYSADVVTSKLSSLNQALASKDEALALQNEALASKDKALAAKEMAQAQIARELEAKNLIIRRLELKNCLTSGTAVTRYSNIVEMIPEEADAGLPWPGPDVDKITFVWNALRQETISEQFIDENKDLHPSLGKVIEFILKNLRPGLMKVHIRCSLSQPSRVPDHIVTEAHISNPGWFDVLQLVEAKLPTGTRYKEGVAEACEYLVELCEKLPKEFAHKGRIALFSDYRRIMLLYTGAAGDVLEWKRTSVVDLLPEGWKDLQQPTVGFRSLCHALCMPVPSPQKLKISGVEYFVQKTIYLGHGHSVLGVNIGGQAVVVKLANTSSKFDRGLLRLEAKKCQLLYDKQHFRPFMVPLVIDQMLEGDGFLMHEATPFLDVVTVDTPAIVIRTFFHQAVDGLYALHSNDYFHGDIRPLNLMVYDGTLRFIDWMTLFRRGSPPSLLFEQGFDDPFQCSDFQHGVDDPAFWDLYGLGYTFAGLGVSKGQHVLMSEPVNRKALMKELACSDGIGHLGARLVLLLDEQVPRHRPELKFYDQIKMIE
jgi:hypothetical protein